MAGQYGGVTDQNRGPSRRDEYAAQTRREVVATARRVFAAQGYAQTTVDTIAREARVSPATVYAQCGGKEGLLGSLMDLWTAGETVERIIADCAQMPSPHDKLRRLAEGYVEIYDESGDIIRIVTAAADSTVGARKFLDVANDRHIEALEIIVEPIGTSGQLLGELSLRDAARIIFFHFHYQQYVLASETFGWGVPRAVEWITRRVEAAILQP